MRATSLLWQIPFKTEDFDYAVVGGGSAGCASPKH